MMRKYIQYSGDELRTQIFLAAARGDQESYAFLLSEFSRRRKSFPPNLALEMASYHGLIPVSWIDDAYDTAIRTKAKSVFKKNSNIYCILLHDPVSDISGIYVGLTGLDRAVRFQNHLDGRKASRYVRNFGKCVLLSFTDHLLKLEYEEALKIEAGLACKFRALGLWVEGGH